MVDANYSTARELLEEPFLDKEAIKYSLISQLISSPQKNLENLQSLSFNLTNLRALVHELKTYQYDVSEADTAGNEIISHIFSNLNLLI